MRRVPLKSVVRESMMVSKVVVDITFHCRLLVFSQSCCEVSAGLPDVGGVAVGASDLISRSMSVPRFVLVFYICIYSTTDTAPQFL